MVAHDVEAEGIDLVLFGPGDQGVIHQLGKHGVFWGRVRAAGGGGDITRGFIQTLVVPRHDLVEHRLGGDTGFVGVVVDHIHDHVHADIFLDGLDHLAEFEDTGGAIRIGGVGAFRCGVVEWIIAPVEGVGISNHAVEFLTIFAILIQGCHHFGYSAVAGAVGLELIAVGYVGIDFAQLAELVIQVGNLGRIFVDGGDIEGRQDLQVGHPSFGKILQVLNGQRVLFGQRHILAAFGSRNFGIKSGQIANMRFIHHSFSNVSWSGLNVWRLQCIPAFRLQIGVVEIDDLAVFGVHGEAQGVGVGDLIAFHLGCQWMVDTHLIAIVGTLQVGRTGIAPGAAGTVEGHVMGAGKSLVSVVDHDFDILCRRSPQAEGDAGVRDDSTVLQGSRFLGIDGIQSLGGLHLGAGIQYTLAVGRDSDQLALEQGLDIDAVRQ